MAPKRAAITSVSVDPQDCAVGIWWVDDRPEHTAGVDQHSAALDRAHGHALDWLASLDRRPVPPQASVEEVTQALGTELPDGPTDPAEVVDLLVEACDPGLTAMPSGRFFGFVIGGTHPAALAADWLVSAWDQNACLRG